MSLKGGVSGGAGAGADYDSLVTRPRDPNIDLEIARLSKEFEINKDLIREERMVEYLKEKNKRKMQEDSDKFPEWERKVYDTLFKWFNIKLY